MKDRCKQAVAQALGKPALTVQEAMDIENRINQTMVNLARQDIQRWRNLTDIEKLSEAGKQVAIDIQSDMARKKRVAVQDILIQSRNLETLKDPSLRISASERVDRMVAAYGDMSGIQSVDSKARAIADIYRGQLVDFYTNINGALGIYTDKVLAHNIVKELFKESTGDAVALKAADGIAKTFDDILERFNRAGGNIKKRKDYGLPQHHGVQQIASAGFDKWFQDTAPLLKQDNFLDKDGYPIGGQELKDVMSDIYTTIVTNGANKYEAGKGGGVGVSSKVTNRHQEARVLNFKDADAWLEYQSVYGGKPLVDVLESHISGMAKEIALVETFGSNPKGNMDILMNTAKQIDTVERGIPVNKAEKSLIRAQAMFDEFMGANQPENRVLANVGLAYRSMNVASMLGGTVLSSATDQAMIAKTAWVHGVSYWKTFGELIKTLNPANKADRDFAHSLGLATQEMLGSINRWSDDGLVSVHGKSEKLARLSNGLATQVMRLSGLNALTEASKIAFTKMMMNKYADLSRSKAWSDLNAVDRELLQGAGLSELDWKVWQLAKPVEDLNGNQLLAARSIYSIPDDLLKGFGDDPKQIKDAVATRLHTHLMDEQGMAVIEAGLRERTKLQLGRPGTEMGEIWRCVTQFKSFPMAFLMRHGSRAMSKTTWSSRAWYAGTLLGLTTLMGALVVQLKELANGNDPATMFDDDGNFKTEGKFFTRAFVAGGGLPILGDILVAGMDPTGRDTSEFMTGPFGSDAKAVLSLTVGNANQWFEGKDTNVANEAFRFAKNKIPAQNLWYTKAVANRMIFDGIQDTIAPGYREKLIRKAEAEQDRTRWLGDWAWDSGFEEIDVPDVGKAVGQ
ncbi:hypothetical protein [Acinetobacter sp. CAAS 2-6]|uniref:hypothetical protein n=1 Tax=Acinetobacter sp. CAAS 2-6 TaxID=3016358 RepID=UPI002DD63252|nr:hypothetical protein [Acinetobacter sp. CAAS 2-6]